MVGTWAQAIAQANNTSAVTAIDFFITPSVVLKW
jgi:hypothetical protein